MRARSHASRARGAAAAGLAVVGEHVVGDEEVLGGQPEDLLHRGDLVGAERARRARAAVSVYFGDG